MKTIFIIILVAICCRGFSQGYDNNWVFGDSAGLSFNTGEPVSFESSMLTFEACASISDSTGNLLFYTNGEKVWNKNHELMQNGDSLHLGGLTLFGSNYTQGVIILPYPENENLYYIFYLTDYVVPEDNFGIEYSIVDMELDGGLGAVTEKIWRFMKLALLKNYRR